jgi:hypothetical protein
MADVTVNGVRPWKSTIGSPTESSVAHVPGNVSYFAKPSAIS